MFKSILRRLRPRFSVRILLALVLVSGIGLGILAATVRKARRQRHAVVATKKLGWWVYYEGEYYQAGFRPRDEPARLGWLREWLGDDFFDRVTHVTLIASSNDIDADMTNIEAFPELEQLCADHLPVTDAGIAHLSGLSKLQRLSLREVPITDAALDPLSRLSSLKVVCLDRTRVGEGALLESDASTLLSESGMDPHHRCRAGSSRRAETTRVAPRQLHGDHRRWARPLARHHVLERPLDHRHACNTRGRSINQGRITELPGALVSQGYRRRPVHTSPGNPRTQDIDLSSPRTRKLMRIHLSLSACLLLTAATARADIRIYTFAH
jgi:hypothetical protein